jgi:hypothetical protein
MNRDVEIILYQNGTFARRREIGLFPPISSLRGEVVFDTANKKYSPRLLTNEVELLTIRVTTDPKQQNRTAMKRAFFALALVLVSLTGCSEPEFTGSWNGRCLVVMENGEEYCFTNIRQAAVAMNADYAVVRNIFINAQQRYAKNVAREKARKQAQMNAR